MVLSLGFILAFIGAAVALLIGILIFSEVSDAIICPAGAGGSGFLINTLPVDFQDGVSTMTANPIIGQRIATSGEQILSVTINNMSWVSGGGTVKSQIYTGAVTDIDTSTFIANSTNTLIITGPASDIDFTWNYIPVVVSDANTYIALIQENIDSDVWVPVADINQGSVGPGFIQAHSATVPTAGFFTPIIHDVGTSTVDMLMQVAISGGGGTGQGSEECENAKDTAWTVIGILPVALFFALFAIFGALGRTS